MVEQPSPPHGVSSGSLDSLEGGGGDGSTPHTQITVPPNDDPPSPTTGSGARPSALHPPPYSGNAATLLSLAGINSSKSLLAPSTSPTPPSLDNNGHDGAAADDTPTPTATAPVSPLRRRAVLAAYIAAVFCCYAVAMFVNGIGKQITQERPLVDLSAMSPATALLFDQLGPCFSLAFYRVLAALLLLGVMYCRGDVPAVPDALTRRLLIPVAIGATNAGGYFWYMILCGLNGVALWSSLVGCYVVIPVAYGILFRGEKRSVRKLAGVAACVTAVLLLSLAGGSAEAANADAGSEAVAGETGALSPVAMGALQAALFLACILTWALSDTLVSSAVHDPVWCVGRVERRHPLVSVVRLGAARRTGVR